MLVRLLRFITGYITVEVSTDALEGFINACYRNKIRLYDSRLKKGKLITLLNPADYKQLRKFRKKYDARIRIVKKSGFPFYIKPYRKRYGIAIGSAVYIVLIAVLSMFVWNIEVKGNKSVKNDEIISACKKIGVYEGALSNTIDTNSARLKFLLDNPKFSWASFIVEGSHITVNVSETREKGKSDTAPSNLISKCDGTITKVMIKKGFPTIKSGEPVFKGQLLASGTMQYKDGSTHFVPSGGEVYAITKHQVKVKVPQVITVKKYIKNYETRSILTAFGTDIPLSLKPTEYQCIKRVEIKRASYKENYSPIYLKTVRFDKEISVLKKLSQSQKREIANKKFKEYENRHKDIKFISFNDEIKTKGKTTCFIRNYKCEENIAVQEKIKISVPKK